MMKQSHKLVLLVNLGSPHELSKSAIRKFLREFLSDQRVVGLPRILWYPILFGIILPLRAGKLLHKYQKIWLDNGSSPLVHYTASQAENLAQLVNSEDTIVDYAFCYGGADNNQRTIGERLKYWHEQRRLDQVIVLPLYPQHSSSTTLSVWDQLNKFYAKSYYIPSINFVNSFATSPEYIQALANQVRKHWEINGKAERLLISFHSVPVKLINKGDSYIDECKQTYHLLCAELGLKADIDAKLSFQSKFGKAKWVEPATDITVETLAKAGIKSIDVICPGFVSDCLETLEEIAIENRDLFIEHGGSKLSYISCFNDDPQFSRLLAGLIK